MNQDELKFFNPWAEIRRTRNRLPHWQQHGAVYFVTFRLADSVPKSLMDRHLSERDAWLARNPKPWSESIEQDYHQKFSSELDLWLDQGHGSCLLKDPENAKIFCNALNHFNDDRYSLISWVTMPNHAHLLFVAHPDWKLEKLIHSWKRHSARKINQLCDRSGPLWQRDYFDRLVRDSTHFANCVRYIRRNPVKARLRPDEFILFESELAKQIE